MKIHVDAHFSGSFDSKELGFDEPIETEDDAAEAVEYFGIDELIAVGLIRGVVDVWVK